MPFTPTHVAAVAPLGFVRTGLPFSALVIGSMISDLPLFLGWHGSYRDTHSVSGLFTHATPLGLIALALFHSLLKTALIELAPHWVRERLGSVREPLSLRALWTWVGGALGVLLGAATHVLWDSFTHADRWGVKQLPVLETTWLSALGRDVSGYKVLQYGSTFVCLPILLLLAWTWLSRQPAQACPSRLTDRTRWRVRVPLVVLPVLVGLGAAAFFPTERSGPSRLALFLYEAITTGGLVLLGLSLAYGLGYAVLTRPRSSVGQEAP